jgi:hypothetical protein
MNFTGCPWPLKNIGLLSYMGLPNVASLHFAIEKYP